MNTPLESKALETALDSLQDYNSFNVYNAVYRALKELDIKEDASNYLIKIVDAALKIEDVKINAAKSWLNAIKESKKNNS